MTTATFQSGTLATMKTDVIRRIKKIDDAETMAQIVGRINEVAPECPSFLTPKQIEKIEASAARGRKDYAEGRWTDHEQVMAEMDQWRK